MDKLFPDPYRHRMNPVVPVFGTSQMADTACPDCTNDVFLPMTTFTAMFSTHVVWLDAIYPLLHAHPIPSL